MSIKFRILKVGREIFLHTGLAKTGTKFLQQNFFPKLKGIKYIPKPRYHRSMEFIQATDFPKYLVSQEYDQQFEREIRRWAKFDPGTKVIVVFRRQDGWFASEYRRFVKNGFRGSFRDFIDLQYDSGYFKISDGMYMPKIRLVEELFDNPPFVLLYDELRADPVRFLHKFAVYMGADFYLDSIDFSPKHTSYEEKQLKVMQLLGYRLGVRLIKYDDENRLHRFFQRLGQMIPRYLILYLAWMVPGVFLNNEPLIPESELEQIRNFYAEDWKQTQQYAEEIQKKLLNL